jgi:hypothetical protein
MAPIETDDVPTLPQLDPGLTLLTATDRPTGALQSLVLDHLLLADGGARWVDARGNATTTSLATLAPSQRTLDRIHVARAFTAFQHYSLLEDLSAAITPDTSLVVAPAVEWFYEQDDLRAGEGEAMLEAGLDLLASVASEHDLPVLLTRVHANGIGTTVEEYCDAHLEYVETPFGPRFTGEDFETLVFECPGGVQTTLAFWRRVLEQRQAALQTGEVGDAPEVISRGTN